MTSKRKAIVLGFDGLDPRILGELMARGDLPHFAALAQSGQFCPLRTVAPPQSPVAWTTMATGSTPAQHGIYDFLTRAPGTYTPRLAIMKQGKLGYRRPFAPRTFWETLSDRGVATTIIRWPLTFPATPINGSLLSGLGTPDIRGTLGRYTYFTSRDFPEADQNKGAIVRVGISNGRIKTQVTGPWQISFQGPTEAVTDLEIELEEHGIRGHLGGTVFTLGVGSWSPWLPMRFKVGFLRTVTGMARLYLGSVRPEFSLYLTPINFSNDTKSPPLSYPLGHGKELAEVVGPFATLGLAEDSNALNDEIIDERAFLASCDLLMAERERIFFHALDNFRQGLLAVVFDTTDRIQHMFWRGLDREHPRHDEETAPDFAATVYRGYQRMDGILGRALAQEDQDTLFIVCSDHGFTTYRRDVHLNTWLVQNGFMTLKEGKVSGEGLFADVDWSATTAFAFGLNSIFINIKDRELQGQVDPARSQALRENLALKLQALTDGGTPVVKNIYTPAQLYGPQVGAEAPDLIIGYHSGYRNSWQTAMGGAPNGEVCEDNRKKWSGDHCVDPEVVPGIFLTNTSGFLREPRVQDLCPAILDYFS